MTLAKTATLLVAHDGSPRAPEVLRAAVHLAKRLGAKIWLFRAVGLPVDLPDDAYRVAPGELAPLLLARAQGALTEAARGVPAELLAGVRVALGTPWQAICDAAHDCEAAVVVIGSHGYGKLDRLLGTTAAKIVNHADRSVLVVRHADLLG